MYYFFYFCLVPAKLLYRQLPLLGLPLNPSIFSRLRYAILFQLALLLISPIQPYQLWLATYFLAYYFILPFQLSHVSVLSGYIPSSAINSALNTVLLVVLEHPSIFLASAICTASSCLTNFAFPSHISPAYSNFGTITLVRIHLLILVSRCESVRIASCLLVIYPFLLLSLWIVHPKSSPLRPLRQGRYTGLRPVAHLLPTSTWNLPDSPCLRYILLPKSQRETPPPHSPIFMPVMSWGSSK